MSRDDAALLASRAYWHERKLEEWYEDRARQALIGTRYGTTSWRPRLSRGEFMRRINNGMALRTFRAIFRDER